MAPRDISSLHAGAARRRAAHATGALDLARQSSAVSRPREEVQMASASFSGGLCPRF